MSKKKAAPEADAAKELAEAVARELSSGLPLLTDEEIRNRMVITRAELDMLERIGSGNPPKNAQAILSAIKMKLEYRKKSGDEDGKGALTVEVVTLPAEAPEI